MNGCGIAAFGDATAFSFHATKLFHTAEGGALAVNSAAAKRHTDLLRNFGIQDEDTVSHIGINGKMSEIQAALGLCVLDAMEEELSNRAAIERIYRARLSKVRGIILPVSPVGVRPSMQYFVVRVVEDEFGRTRDEVHTVLKQHNAITRKYFSPLVSDALCYKQIPSAAPQLLPVAQRVAREVLALPFYGALGRDGAERVCDLIEDARRSAWT
jgi:dTDP-4-amino-4,6-dideoxygalactose transaminase